ncbi:GTPase-associated system all-helical protein GASH [Hymenobacter rubidus]|uniref:GTPase-associated system all-helical protein GASH n=1 Tax=Hymenobacter rubidus TaxID=1441626 RepID=UPI00191FB694|nr:GTPase-associated system all-helical protein GASH [Hymenobacter rubidus]
MTTTAKDQLPRWIEAVAKKEIPSAQLELRQGTISKLLGKTHLPYWIGLIKLFSGFSDEDGPEFNDLMKEFFKDDDNFPLKNNSQLVRVLAGSLLAQKIESRSTLSDTLMLALLTANFATNRAELPILELLVQIEALWLQKCSTSRDLPSANGMSQPKTTSSKATLVAGATINEKVQEHLNSLFTDVKSQHKFISSIVTYLTDLEKRVASNSEETNILSWILREHSREVPASFTEIGATRLPFIGAKDLAVLTAIAPGLPDARGILHKMLQTVGTSDDTITLAEIVRAFKEKSPYTEWVTETTKLSLISSGESITPLLYALHCSQEPGWEQAFPLKASFPLEHETTLLNFAMQFYKECMLMSIVHRTS